MGAKLCPHVILEGTRLTQKTDLAFALNQHPRFVGPRKYAYHSPIISAEWCAFTNTPWGRGMINYEPQEAALALESYQTWMRLFELQRYYSWIIDRFHLSTQMVQARDFDNAVNFDWLEQRLKALNFRVILCTRTEASFEAARVERLKVSGNPAQYDDLTVFYREQAALRELASTSTLDVLEVDVSEKSVAAAADEVVDWLAATNGLTLD